MIETRDLTKRFGSVLAVDGLTVEVSGPGLVGFLGPNGAGKTTTMRLLTGYLPMTSGDARVAGFDVFDDPLEVKARVGYLPETPPLYPELSVGEYLRFVAEIRGVPRGRRFVAVGHAMEQVGLDGWEGRLLGTLSKGYRQRVGLAQAIVHEPRLLILDEPTSGLDPAQLVPIRKLISDLAAERTVVLSTHVLPEIEVLCDRILVIDAGRLVADGTVDTLAAGVGTGPWVELAVDTPFDDLCAPIAALESVAEVSRMPPMAGAEISTRYQIRGTEAVEPALGALAGAHGWKIRTLVRHRPSLQDVFVALVEAR